MISNDPKFNLGQLNAYKLMFAIKLSMKEQVKQFLSAWFSDLPAINATSFSRKFLCMKLWILTSGLVMEWLTHCTARELRRIPENLWQLLKQITRSNVLIYFSINLCPKTQMYCKSRWGEILSQEFIYVDELCLWKLRLPNPPFHSVLNWS